MSARYEAKAGDALVVKIGISYTSLENARNNLHTECPHWDFDRVVQESRDEWNDWLGKVAVNGGSAVVYQPECLAQHFQSHEQTFRTFYCIQWVLTAHGDLLDLVIQMRGLSDHT